MIPHLEDVAFAPTRGLPFLALNVIGDVLVGGVQSRLRLSVKWDGAPALVFGKDEHGVFFVSTKAAFNVQPVRATSHADIDRLFANARVCQILHTVFPHLQALGASGIIQGDLLFTADMLAPATIDGRSYVTFRPNTITYAVPVGSPLNATICNATMGIALHTMVGDDGLKPLTPDVFASLKRTGEVFLVDATNAGLDTLPLMTDETADDFALLVDAARHALHSVTQGTHQFMRQEPMRSLMPRFINFALRQGLPFNPSELFIHLSLFLQRVRDKEVSLRTSAKGQGDARFRYDSLIHDVHNNRQEQIAAWLRYYTALINAKMLLVRQLEKAPRAIHSYIQTDAGYVPTAPEGFVATIGGIDGPVKLVDRTQFSRLNMTLPRNW